MSDPDKPEDEDSLPPVEEFPDEEATTRRHVDAREMHADESLDPEGPAGEFPDEEGTHHDLTAEDPDVHLRSIIESLLFVADKPLSLQQLAGLLGESDIGRVREAVSIIEVDFAERGFQLQQVAGGFQFRTHPRNANWVQKLLAQKPVRLSRALLETLAIVSYRQPITRPEIDEIRGVDSGGTLKTLMDRALVRILGKKEEPGRPILYGTTRDFLEFFNLKDLKDLPTLREFHELSDEHKAQVEALESAAPEGSIIDEEPQTLQRVNYTTPIVDDAAELEEIDRLIRTAPNPDPEPAPVPVPLPDPKR